MAGVENGRKADTRLKRLDDHGVDVIVDNVAFRGVVDGVDDFIVAVLFIAVEVLGLTTVA